MNEQLPRTGGNLLLGLGQVEHRHGAALADLGGKLPVDHGRHAARAEVVGVGHNGADGGGTGALGGGAGGALAGGRLLALGALERDAAPLDEAPALAAARAAVADIVPAALAAGRGGGQLDGKAGGQLGGGEAVRGGRGRGGADVLDGERGGERGGAAALAEPGGIVGGVGGADLDAAGDGLAGLWGVGGVGVVWCGLR